MSGARAWLLRASLGLLLCVLLAGLLTARMVAEGEAALSESDAAFDRGDLRAAVFHARRAATCYAPGAPHVRGAYVRLGAVALGAEALGDADLARAAWEAMRGAALETRHVTQPHPGELARATAALVRLGADSGRGATPADRGRAARFLSRADAPRTAEIALLGLGLGLTALGALGLALGARREPGRPLGRVVAGALLLVGVACWTLAASRA